MSPLCFNPTARLARVAVYIRLSRELQLFRACHCSQKTRKVHLIERRHCHRRAVSRAMNSFTFIAFASILIATVSAHNYASYNHRKCTATGAKCAGAHGKPFVKVRFLATACLPTTTRFSDECVANRSIFFVSLVTFRFSVRTVLQL
jgi:hypothetical protein